MLNIIQRIVHEELQLRDDAELLADAGTEFVAHLSLVGVDVLYDSLRLLAGEDAEIDAAHAEVRADAAGTHTHQHPSHRTGLLLKDIAQLLLNEPGYLVLSGCFHTTKLKLFQ